MTTYTPIGFEEWVNSQPSVEFERPCPWCSESGAPGCERCYGTMRVDDSLAEYQRQVKRDREAWEKSQQQGESNE